MAKAKLHLPASTRNSSLNPLDPYRRARIQQSKKSLEELSVQLQKSLARMLLPQLCKTCKDALTTAMEFSRSNINGKYQMKQTHLDQQQSKQHHNKDGDNGKAPKFSIESICNKCKATILGDNKHQENNPKRQPIKSSRQTNNTPQAALIRDGTPSTTSTVAYLADTVRSIFARFYSASLLDRSANHKDDNHNRTISSGIASPIAGARLNFYARCLKEGKSWCRFCGTTFSSKWCSGPWGPKTVCFRHSSTFRGSEQINLNCFLNEKPTRSQPVVKEYCRKCWTRLDVRSSCLRCFGCPFSYHIGCFPPTSHTNNGRWFCSESCLHNIEALEIKVDLPYQALMPFCEVEVVSDTGDVPPMNCQDKSMTNRKRKSTREVEEPNSTSKRKASPLPDRHNNTPLAEIPVPGVIRHHIPAYRRLIHTSTKNPTEYFDDASYLDRHKRYEMTEMQSRICRPQILKKLMVSCSAHSISKGQIGNRSSILRTK